MIALVDSSVWIAASKNETHSEWALTQLAALEFPHVSPIVLAELKLGVNIATTADAVRARQIALDAALDAHCLPITSQTSDAHARLVAELLRVGKSRWRGNDLWLAASALEHQVSVLTCNARDFADVVGLRLICP